jgi:hypothetical protein
MRIRTFVLLLAAAVFLGSPIACDVGEKKQAFKCNKGYYEDKATGACIPEGFTADGGLVDAGVDGGAGSGDAGQAADTGPADGAAGPG